MSLKARNKNFGIPPNGGKKRIGRWSGFHNEETNKLSAVKPATWKERRRIISLKGVLNCWDNYCRIEHHQKNEDAI